MNIHKGFILRHYTFLYLLILFFIISFLYKPLMIFHPAKGIENSDSITTSQIINQPEYYTSKQEGDTLSFNKTNQVQKIKDPTNLKVIPGGHSIGIHLETLGVLVVGHYYVNGNNGTISPAKEADIHVGDSIIEIDNKEITDLVQVKPFIENAGENNKALHVTLKRDEELIRTTLQPVKDVKDDSYSIGLYIRDTAAGIGTLSFYDPESKKFGALGHVISDADTKKAVEIKTGKIIQSKVMKILKGKRNLPGEKQAKFSMTDTGFGTVTKNSPYGIFGTLFGEPKDSFYQSPMEIGYSNEVVEGPAEILTVVDDEKIEKYSIEIINNKVQSKPSLKGMTIKITDEELINKTGGIVQGMSGSPIIQNGKIIGAITHVFVNDPTSGYGVHIEWMLQDADIIQLNPALMAS